MTAVIPASSCIPSRRPPPADETRRRRDAGILSRVAAGPWRSVCAWPAVTESVQRHGVGEAFGNDERESARPSPMWLPSRTSRCACPSASTHGPAVVANLDAAGFLDVTISTWRCRGADAVASSGMHPNAQDDPRPQLPAPPLAPAFLQPQCANPPRCVSVSAENFLSSRQPSHRTEREVTPPCHSIPLGPEYECQSATPQLADPHVRCALALGDGGTIFTYPTFGLME